ncbi:MAG: solute-binding protein, partial [Akkermansiaceae bacterium]|nr:solute-binding protein [Akkermansiaceae bacterium]
DELAVEAAREAGAVEEVLPLCRQYPVIAVQAGNPKQVRGFDDLFREDLKVAVANPEAASVGKATKAAVGARWDELAGKVTVMKPTVTELAADLSLGSIDAAVLWNSTVPQFKGIEA